MKQESSDFLFMHSPVAQLVINPKGTILKSNTGLDTLLDSSTQMLKDTCFFDLLSPSSKIHFTQTINFQLSQKYSQEIFLEISNAPFQVQSVLLENNTFLLAITSLAKPKKKEKENTHRFSPILENLSVPIIIVDILGNYSTANQHFFNLLGHTHNELILKNIKDISTPYSAENLSTLLEHIRDQKKHRFTTEHEFICKDGTSLWTKMDFVAIEENNSPLQYGTMSLSDISKIKLVEQQLNRNRKWIDEISEIVPAGMAVLDTEGNVIRLNPFLTELFGYKKEDIPNLKAWMKLAYPDKEYRKRILKRWLRDFYHLQKDHSISKNAIERIFCKNGEMKDVSIRYKMVNGRLLVIFIDITDVKTKERKLKESNSTKDKLFSIIAHDLKNPFNTLIGYSELLNIMWDRFEPDERRDHVKRIEKAARKGFDLLENLLVWAKRQTDQIAFHPEILSLSPLFEHLQSLFEEQAAAKDVKLIFHAPNELIAYADKDMLKTILRNLIANAIKFSTQGGEVAIKAQRFLENIAISVKDNGVGIPIEHQRSLFSLVDKPIQRGTSGEKGSGIGLNLCKEFVEQNGGILSVQSTVGEGSEFSFILPCSPP